MSVCVCLHETKLYQDISKEQWPIIYDRLYNVGFLGVEKLHPFDSKKWGRVFKYLKEKGMIQDKTIVHPEEASFNDLSIVHTKDYINSLKWSVTVARITEVGLVALLPNCVVQKRLLKPFRYQTAGTIMAGKLAVERGWAINIGGGFHHCSSNKGGGFCAYADITLCINFLFDRVPGIAHAMIVDLDAHQGNGHERDFMGMDKVYIMDVYNWKIYPRDEYAKGAIKKKVELEHNTQDNEYLQLVEKNLDEALSEFKPDIIVYNAGTDILDGDPLGKLSITSEGIIRRDELVFRKARSKKIPIVMVTSGGYQRRTSRVIADSILNLHNKNLISRFDPARDANTGSANTVPDDVK